MAEPGPLSNRVLGGRYVLGDLLGEGGFGEVYQAINRPLNRPQAIKVLLEKHLRNPRFRERFIREAQTLAALDHPNIVHVDELGEERDLVYLVMPYISGGTLQHILKQRAGPLGMPETQHYLEQICAALGYAHARQVVHLDLKPLNLLVHADGRLLLSDFGLAHLIKEGVVEGGTSLQFGTPFYMAPEHLRGQPDWRSDLYAAGVMLYQMLTGRLPFEASTPEAIIFKLVAEPPPPLRSLRPDLPAALESVLSKALAKQPEARFQSASDLLAAFKSALSARPASSPLPPTRYDSQPALGPTIRASHPPAWPGGTPSGGLSNPYLSPTIANRPSYPLPYPPAVRSRPASRPAKQWHQLSWALPLLGGVLALAAFFLPWFRIEELPYYSDTIIGSSFGSRAFNTEPIIAALLICSGALGLKIRKIGATLSVVGSLLGIAVTGYLFYHIAADDLFHSNDITVTLDIGFWLAIVGFALGLTGAIIGLTMNRAIPRKPKANRYDFE